MVGKIFLFRSSLLLSIWGPRFDFWEPNWPNCNISKKWEETLEFMVWMVSGDRAKDGVSAYLNQTKKVTFQWIWCEVSPLCRKIGWSNGWAQLEMEHDGTEYMWVSKRCYPGELHDGWHIPGWLSAYLRPHLWPLQPGQVKLRCFWLCHHTATFSTSEKIRLMISIAKMRFPNANYQKVYVTFFKSSS